LLELAMFHAEHCGADQDFKVNTFFAPVEKIDGSSKDT
jgi:hypothetical protein